MLKVRTETVHFVDYYDFEQFVKGVYGRDFCFVSAVECGNDTDHTFHADKSGVIYSEGLSEWFRGDTDFIFVHDLFTDLCLRDEIEPGTYVVQVSW